VVVYPRFDRRLQSNALLTGLSSTTRICNSYLFLVVKGSNIKYGFKRDKTRKNYLNPKLLHESNYLFSILYFLVQKYKGLDIFERGFYRIN